MRVSENMTGLEEKQASACVQIAGFNYTEQNKIPEYNWQTVPQVKALFQHSDHSIISRAAAST